MNLSELKTALGVTNGALSQTTVTIGSTTLTANLPGLLNRCYAGTSIVLDEAQLVGESDSEVVLSGNSSFLGMPNLAVTLTASVTESGDAQLVLEYALLGANPGPNDWTFSRSFPDMPRVPDPAEPTYYNRETGVLTAAEMVPLDKLRFFDCSLVVCTHPVTVDSRTLKFGINFVGKLRPEGALGMLANVFGSNIDLEVNGRICRPLSTETPQALEASYAGNLGRGQYPWTVDPELEHGVPGILLEVSLPIHYSLGQAVDFEMQGLVLYSPLTATWELPESNPKFVPYQALLGVLDLPDAGIQTDMLVTFTPGRDVLEFAGNFAGISLNGLSQLAGLTGGDDPLGMLPTSLQNLGSGLGSLELIDATLVLDYRSLQHIEVQQIEFTVGMPELNWELWPNTFSLAGISTVFTIDFPFQAPSDVVDPDLARALHVTLEASMQIEGIDFSVFASSRDSFSFYANMAPGNSLPLGDVLARFAPGIPSPSALTIDMFRLGISPGTSYSLALAMADGPEPWTLDLGPVPLVVSDVAMSVVYDQANSTTTGSVSGAIAVGELLTLNMAYDTPGDVVIHSRIPRVTLRELTSALCEVGLPVPGGVDFTLINSSVLMRKEGSEYSLQLGTEVPNFGSLALQVGRQGGSWGIAVGLDMTGSKLSDIPGLAALRPLEKRVTLDKLCVVISTLDRPDFTFPDLAQFDNPAINSSSVPMPQGQTGVAAGLNIYTRWTLDTSRKDTDLLRQILGLNPELDMTLVVGQNPAEDSRLFLDFATSLAGNPLTCQVGFMISGGTPQMFCAGALVVDIQDTPTTFSIGLSVLPTGFFFAGSMLGSVSFGSVTLSNLGVALGFNWAGIPSFGITGSLAIDDLRSSLAILFDSTDPKKSLLAGSVAPMTLRRLAELFVPGKELGDIGELLGTVSLEGTQGFELAASVGASLDSRNLGEVATAFLASAGISLSASSDVTLLVVHEAGHRWAITDMFNNMRHYDLVLDGELIRVVEEPQFYLAPATARMGALTFNQGFFLSGAIRVGNLSWMTRVEVRDDRGIAAESALDGPLVIYKPSFFQLTSADGTGGAQFSMATYTRPEHPDPECQGPHFLLDGKLNLIGLQALAKVYLSTNGFAFQIEMDQSRELNWRVINGSLTTQWALAGELQGTEVLGVSGALNYQLAGRLDIDKLLAIDGVELGSIDLDMGITGSLDLGYDENGARAALAGSFTFQGVDAAFSVSQAASSAQMKTFFNLVFAEIKTAISARLADADGFIDGIEQGWVNFTEDVDALAAGLENGFGVVDSEMARLLRRRNVKLVPIIKILKQRFDATAEEAGAWLKATGAQAKWLGNALRREFELTAAEGAELLKEIGYSAAEVTDALKFATSWAADVSEVLPILLAISFPSSQIGPAVKDAFSVTRDQMVTLAHAAGYGSVGLTRILKAGWPQVTYTEVATYLKGLGKGSREVANRLRGEFGCTAQQASNCLTSIGYLVYDVARALHLSYEQTYDQATMILKKSGFSALGVAVALHDYFKTGATDAGKALALFGFAAKDIAKALRKDALWDKGCNSVARILKDAGFTESTVEDALEAAGWAANTISNAINKWF